MISMDGIQPEKGNETLYVIREIFSGTILAAQNLKSGSAEKLKKFITPIIELGFRSSASSPTFSLQIFPIIWKSSLF